MNVNKIKGKMRELGITYTTAGEALHMTASTFSNKLNGKRNSKFFINELDELGNLLNLSRKERSEFFL